MPYYGQNASAVGVPMGAPDLSNVMKMARSTGRNAAYADFLEDLFDLREKQAKEEAAAAKARQKAAEDNARESASENDGGSFLSKIADAGLDSLGWTLDKLSRPGYAVSNTIKYLQDQDDDKHDDPNFLEAITGSVTGKNAFHWIDDLNVGDVGGALKAAWEGFSGEEKTTGSDIIKANAEDYELGTASRKVLGNKWYQGVAGFGLDVANDPLTYVGTGMVTRPLRKVAERAVDDDLIEDLAKQGLRRRDLYTEDELLKAASESPDLLKGLDVELNADDFRQILKQTEPNLVTPKGLTWRQRRAWEKAHTIKGRQALTKRSESVASTNRKIENMSRIATALAKPAKGIDESPAIKRLREMMDETQAQLTKAVETSGSRAYKLALAKAAKNGTPTTAVGKFEKAVEFSRMSRLMKAASMRDSFQNKYNKTGQGGTQAKYFEQKIAEAEAEMAELSRGWSTNPALSRDAMAQAWGAAKSYSNSDATTRQLVRRAVNASNHARELAKKVESQGIDPTKHAGVQRANAAADRFNRMVNDRRAVVFKRTLANRAGLSGAMALPKHAENRVTEITAEIEQIDELLKNQSSQYTAEGSKILSGGDEAGEIARKREALVDERDKIFRDHMSKDIFNPDSVEAIADRKFSTWNSARKAFMRKAADGKYRVEDLPEDLRPMFGSNEGKQSVLPKIVVEGEEILRDAKSKPALRKLVTDEDTKVGPSKNFSNAKEVSKDGKPIILHGDIATNPKEYEAFDRIFESQHGQTVEEALTKLQLAEGNFIEIAGQKIVRGDWARWAKDHPEKLWKLKIKIPVGKAKEIKNKSTGEIAAVKQTWTTTNNPKFADREGKWMEDLSDAQVNNVLREYFNRNSVAAKLRQGEEQTDITSLYNEKKSEFIQEARQELEELGVKQESALDRSDLMLPDVSVEDIKDAGIALAKQEYEEAAQAAREAAMARPGKPGTKRFALENELARLKNEMDETIAQHKEAYQEAIDTREMVSKRFAEEMKLNAIDKSIQNGRHAININFAGATLMNIPSPEFMFKAVEKFSNAPLFAGAWNAWSRAFHPASKLEPEMNLARLRMQARTPEIIKHHMEDLVTKFSKFKPAQRKAALLALRKGNSTANALSKAVKEELDSIVPYLDGSMRVGDESLDLYDVNAYLPSEFKFFHDEVGKTTRNIRITDGMDIVKHMRRLNPNSDPMKALWSLRIATEQAMAHKALKQTVRDIYGIKREVLNSGKRTPAGQMVEDLHFEHGWQQVDGMGDSHYYPAEVADQIDRLLKMIKPGSQEEILGYFDKVLRAWKSTVTVYNPGYYTRNAIGESMMCMFDGVAPHYFKRASTVLRAKDPDATEEAIKAMQPWKKFASQAQKDSRIVAKLQSGRKLNADEVWVLYHEAGLKSGFISSEFDHLFPQAGTVRATAVGQLARGVNDTVRKKGESFEDYFRLTHFISRLERAPRGMDVEEAAKEAADYVRKYHFDYTDFTPFEKAAMMRVFPFYKWTRKAAPLMLSMVLTRPGMVTLYPKLMTDLGYATGAVDPEEDTNGFLPNYEGVVPKWMKSMFAYPVGPTNENGENNYMNIATPALDIYKLVGDPAGSATGMLNPMLKLPIEFAQGRTMDPEFNIDLTKEGQAGDHLMRTTPLTSLINKINNDKDSEQVWFSFLSGLGLYENTEARQQGELMRQRGISNG